METHCVRIKLREGQLHAVAAWAEEVNRRRAEAVATMKNEGIAWECAFLERASDGDYLIYIIRAENLAAALPSKNPLPGSIDAFHKEFKKSAWESQSILPPLIDIEAQ